MDSTGGEPSMRKQVEEESEKRSAIVGMRSQVEPVAEELLRTEAKFKKPNSKRMNRRQYSECWTDDEPCYLGVLFGEGNQLLEEQLAKQNKKNRNKITAEAKVREHHGDWIGHDPLRFLGVTLKEAEKKRNQKKIAETKMKMEDARKAIAYLTEAERPEESVIGAWEATIAEEKSGKRSEMQRHAEEPLWMEAKAKEKKKKKKIKIKSREHAQDSIGSYQLAQMCYEGLILKEANKIHKKHQEQSAKKKKKKKLSAEAKVKDEDAGKVVASVTVAGRPEESMTEAWKAEEAVPVGSSRLAMNEGVISPEREESVTEGVKMEAEEGALLVGLNSTVGDEESRKRSDMQWHLEEPREPIPDFYLCLQPEYREKLMKHNAARAEAMNKLLFGHEKLLDSKRSENSAGGIQEETENELGKKLEMMRIRQLYTKIQRALFKIEYKLTNKKMDKETMQLLKDMSNKLDMLDQGSNDDETDEIDDSGKPLGKKTVAEEMADEAERFASYRRLWEYKQGKTCGLFTDITVLSSMQFTHYTPGRRPYSGDCYAAETLQIISIKLTELAGGLELPLSVYGVVAVRDMVDRNRNILFFRDRSEAQELKQNDPLLHLIGPSRAIVFTDKVSIEIELRVIGGAYSQDKDLISCARCYTGWNGPGVSTICFKNVLCTLELCLQPVKETVQATIMGVQVARSWPLKYGGLVACSPLSGRVIFTDDRMTHSIDPSSSQIVLIEAKDEAVPKGEDGYVHLWRQVVSVELEGRLDVVIKAYSKSGHTIAETCVPFYPKVCNISQMKCSLVPFHPKVCNISQMKCSLGAVEVAVTVAWSLVATNKTGLKLELSGRRCV